jgi:hypothetical protein
MQSEIRVGQRFKFNILSDNPSEERTAVVTREMERKGSGRRWNSTLHIGWRLTNFQKQRLRRRWCFSVELTTTYTSTDVRLASLC